MGTSTVNADVAVVGGGPAGLTTAIALASAGVATVLIAKSAGHDNRTTLLLAGSVTALDTLGVWGRCQAHAAPLRVMRLIDDTARLIRATEASFSSSEIGLAAFGYNIANRDLLVALETRARELPALQWIADEARAVDLDQCRATVRLASNACSALLVIGADGRRSVCRAAAGIEVDGSTYPQTALTFNLGHARPHHDISTEFHTESGPFTLVPLPGLRSSLVWVAETACAELIYAFEDAELAQEIERRSHSILGKITVEASRGAFPLAIETARRFGDKRVALVGEAAHSLPPIGAQGLNLGLRDAATISEIVVDARRNGMDVGATEILSRYDALRRVDITSRTLAVDLLNRSLLSDFLPLQGARGLGLFMIDRVRPLRRAVMREGALPASQPRLMRGEAL